MNWVAVRNTLIIAALAGFGLLWRHGFSSVNIAARQIFAVIFIAALIGFGYRYFRENRLAWLVLRPWQRVVIIAAAVAIAFLVIGGVPLFGDRLSTLGVYALVAALVLLIVWVVRQSRRLP